MRSIKPCLRILPTAVLLGLALGGPASGPALAQEPPPSFLSRITIEIPLVTYHIPRRAGLNDHNWGAVIDFALDRDWSIVGGDFVNSYDRNTAFMGVRYSFLQNNSGHFKFDLGGVLAADLNGGYRHYSSIDPLMAALSIKVMGVGFGGESRLLNHTGLVFTIVPNTNTAINAALAIGL